MDPEEQSIGVKLSTAREAAGLTRDDVHYTTRLPKAVIAALEAEDFASFASPVYARSFLSQYSEYLRVNADPWLDALEPGGYSADGTIGPLVDVPAGETHRNDTAMKHFGHGGWFAMPLLMLFSVGMVALAVKGYEYFEMKFPGDEETAPAADTAPPATRSAASPSPPASTSAAAQPPPAEDAAADPPPRAVIVR